MLILVTRLPLLVLPSLLAQMVELLLAHCIEQGYTCHLEYALMWAAEAGNVATVRRMLELDPHDQGKLDGGLQVTWDAEVGGWREGELSGATTAHFLAAISQHTCPASHWRSAALRA